MASKKSTKTSEKEKKKSVKEKKSVNKKIAEPIVKLSSSEIRITPSSIYGMRNCDGFIIASRILPRIKIDPRILERGILLHRGAEFIGINTDEAISRVIETINEAEIKGKSEISSYLGLIQKRWYFNSQARREFALLDIKGYIHPDTVLDAYIDLLTIDKEKQAIVIVDYKTSYTKSQAYTEQVKFYISLLMYLEETQKLVSNLFEMDISEYDWIGVVDYLPSDSIDEFYFHPVERAQFEEEIRTVVLRIQKYLNYDKNTNERLSIEYNAGDWCTYCPIKGVCRLYQMTVSASINLLQSIGSSTENTPIQKLTDEYNKLYELADIIENRMKAIQKALVMNSLEANVKKLDNISIRSKTTYTLNQNTFKADLLKIVNSLQTREELYNFVQDILQMKLESNKSIMEHLPPYLKKLIRLNTNINNGDPYVQIDKRKPRNELLPELKE
jgi:hypothetical protein